MWKARNIGSGKLVAWDNLDKDGKLLPYEQKITKSGSQGSNACVEQDNSCTTAETPAPTQPESSFEYFGVEDSDSGVISCPEPVCIKQYITVGKLEKHVASEKHTFQDVSEPLGDRIMKKWAEQFEQVPTSGNLSSQLESKLSSIHLTDNLSVSSYKALQKGWALKIPKRGPRFPDKVRNYLQEKFDIGNTTGHKSDPVQVSVDMRCARD